MVRSGSSYASQSELALTFGLGRDSVITRVEIAWPSGLQERFADVAVDKMVIATEGKGLAVVDGYGGSGGR
jgi:hypothetical protein